MRTGKQVIIFFLLCLSRYGYGQTILSKQVRLPQQRGTVGELLAALSSIDGVSLSYSSGVISMAKRVELSGKETVVEDYLKSVLKNQPVKYMEKDGKVFIVFDERSPYKKKITISGYIVDKKSGERLIGASIYAVNKNQGTTSNSYGFFSLTLDRDSTRLVISHAGYFMQAEDMLLAEDIVLELKLEPNIIVNEIVVVNSEGRKNSQNRTLPGKINMPATMIKSLPALLGEADVLKSLQLLPGIQAGNEGTAGLNVRGGSADQNLILLDGVPVYNATHAFGLFSIFNADAVHNVEVMKSGFPASYGGRLSSVIDVQFKEGDKNRFHGEGGVGLIFSKLTLEGPLKKGKSSFLISARRTYIDLILRPILKASEGANFDLRSVMSDINLKTNFTIGKKDHLYFSFYTGVDKYSTQSEETSFYFPGLADSTLKTVTNYGFFWGNNTAMGRWNHVFSKKMFSNLTCNYTRFLFDVFTKSESKNTSRNFTSTLRQKYFSSIRDISIKYDIDYLPVPTHFIKFGSNVTLHHYRPGVSEYYQKDTIERTNIKIDNNSLFTGEYDLYAEDDIRLSDRLKINAGLRFSGFSVANKFFTSVQPRLNWLYRLNNKWSLKGSAVKMNQYIHLLTNGNLGLPTDLWLPVTKRVPPQVSYQVAGAVSYSYDKSMEASAEVYYKKLKNVIEYAEGTGFTNSFTNWEDLLQLGKGKAYGMEWMIQKKKGKLTGLLSYTLSWSKRQFDKINAGKPFPYKFDRRHEIKTAIVWQPRHNLEISADWFFASGNAISLPKGQYYNPVTATYIDIYEGRNDFRMPAYHRMDIAIKWMKQRKKFLRTWTLSVFNAYNQQNTFFLYKSNDYLNNRVKFRKVTLFPVLPSVTYQFKF